MNSKYEDIIFNGRVRGILVDIQKNSYLCGSESFFDENETEEVKQNIVQNLIKKLKNYEYLGETEISNCKVIIGKSAIDKWEFEKQMQELNKTDRWKIATVFSINEENLDSILLDEYQKNHDYKPSAFLESANKKIIKAGFSDSCSRCKGTGKYSYNHWYGDLCMKCKGSSKTVTRLNKSIKLEIKTYFSKE